MRSQVATKASSDFCTADAVGICQATIAVLVLFGALWSVGLLL